MQKIAKLIASETGSLSHVFHRGVAVSVASVVLLLSGVAVASELAGTWRGALTRDNKTFEVEITFSQAGYFILAYTNNSGQTRSVDLTTPGQKIQYVPPGGGVKTIVVDSIVRQPGRLSFVMRTTFERASGGYLDQRYILESLDFELTSQGLSARLVTRSATHFGDKDLSTGGGDESVTSGVLQKAD